MRAGQLWRQACGWAARHHHQVTQQTETSCSSSTMPGNLCLIRTQPAAWPLLISRISPPHACTIASASTSAITSSHMQRRGGLKQLMQDFKQLSKFKLSALVVLTSAAGYVAGSGQAIDWGGLGWTALGTFGAAACANTLNQIYEVVNDAKMTRTCNRPLPAGRLTRGHAAVFALAMGAAGLGVLYDKTNALTAGLGASNIVLYACVYTPLKQLTVANTWVGALVGAIPPLMGWAAASGSLDSGAYVLAAALFSWQMPHFLALAWLCKDDYIRGGFQMLSRIDPQGRRVARAALRHCVYLLPIGLLAYLCDVTTWPFAVEAAALSAALGVYALRFTAAPNQHTARRLFRVSLMYLPLLMAGLAVHRLPNTHSVGWEQLRAKSQLLLEEAGVAQVLDGVRDAVSDIASRVDADSLLIRCPSKVHCKEKATALEGQAEGRRVQTLLVTSAGRSQQPSS